MVRSEICKKFCKKCYLFKLISGVWKVLTVPFVKSVPLTIGPLIPAEIVNVSFFFFNVIGRSFEK